MWKQREERRRARLSLIGLWRMVLQRTVKAGQRNVRIVIDNMVEQPYIMPSSDVGGTHDDAIASVLYRVSVPGS
jgi:hypothetical protein